MIVIVLIVTGLALLCLFLLLRYERFAKREPEHGALTESLLTGIRRGIVEDLKRLWPG